MLGIDITYEDGKRARQLELAGYWIDYHHGGDTLVVTFESAGFPSLQRLRKPWGYDFFEKRGYSVLGIKYKKEDWYRGADLHRFFRSEEMREISRRYSSICLFGGSMGGYAALTFAGAFPGCTSLALNPQSTMDPDLVPWDVRFPATRKLDWSGDFSDGSIGASAAGRVYAVYDPFYRFDRMHIDRLDQSNLVRLRLPFVGHEVPKWLGKMGILKQVIEGILSGEFREQDFRILAMARKKLPRYYATIAEKKLGSCLAKACVEKALSLDPFDEDALLAACKVNFVEKRYDHVLSMLKTMPGMLGVEYCAQAYLQLGLLDKADEVLSLVLIKKDVLAKHYFMSEKIAKELGRDQIAAEIARERIKRERGDLPVR